MTENKNGSEKLQLYHKKRLEARPRFKEGYRGLQDYIPSAGDVFVATYVKSGTTLLQHLVYQLVVASGGGPEWDRDGTSFRELGEVAPWIEYSGLTGISSCNSTPRIFKTHLHASSFDLSNTKVRYIYCYRNGEKIPASWAEYSVKWVLPGVQLTDSERNEFYRYFVSELFLGGSQPASLDQAGDASQAAAEWFRHVCDWTQERRPNVLVLRFEEIVADLETTAHRIADFLQLAVDKGGIQRATARCDRDTMANDGKFRETLVAKGLGWDPHGDVKVRPEDARLFRNIGFSEEEKEKYVSMMVDTFGVSSYEEMTTVIDRWQTQ